MDLVSIETPSENDLIEELIAGGNDKSWIHSVEITKSLRFYVKSKLENLEVLKLPFLPFLRYSEFC